MRLKLIGCEVLTREICLGVASSPHTIDIEFTAKDLHNQSSALRAHLQERIDAAVLERRYDAVLLGFGLCGNATLELRAREIPLVLPRAHDCCTLFLGSREKFNRHFGDNLSAPFTSTGYMERSDGNLFHNPSDLLALLGGGRSYADLVAEYGEETASYVRETLLGASGMPDHTAAVYFIEIPETQHLGFAAVGRASARAAGKEFVLLPGSMVLMKKLTFGEWDDDFLIVQPGEQIIGLYDMEQIVAAEACGKGPESR